MAASPSAVWLTRARGPPAVPTCPHGSTQSASGWVVASLLPDFRPDLVVDRASKWNH